jgi:Ca2+-transporting ATPase
MATADHPAVAEVLARDIGLIKEKEQIITGNEMARMNQGKLEQLTEEASIFAQLEPEQKRRVIDALKARGRVTMAAESRTQDLAVLEQADLGIAMGRSGSDAVRQSSDLVLADDRLTTILDAVQEGRAIFEPVRRSLVYLLSTNLGEVLILLAVLALRLPLLLTPIMILWVNLIIDGFCKLPLAMEPVRRDVLSELPRRRKAPVITFKMISHILLLAIWIAAGTLGIYLGLRESVSIATARTMAFSTLVAFQWFNALNSRDERGSLFSIGLFSNLWLLAAILGTAAMQAAVIYVPALQNLMGTVALSGSQWGIVLLVSGSLWIISEIRKLIAPRLFSEVKAHDPEIYVHR